MNARDYPEPMLAHLREFALIDLGELLAQLDAGLVELVEYTNLMQFDAETNKPSGARTYTIIVRKAIKS